MNHELELQLDYSSDDRKTCNYCKNKITLEMYRLPTCRMTLYYHVYCYHRMIERIERLGFLYS